MSSPQQARRADEKLGLILGRISSIRSRLNSLAWQRGGFGVLAWCIAIGALTVLAAYYLDGRTLAEIARMLGVHESTISRKVDKLAKSLRKKILATGMRIQVEPRVGYEIEASHIPELNRRLSDKIVIALNLARSTDEQEVASYLETALKLAEINREKWLRKAQNLLPAAVAA